MSEEIVVRPITKGLDRSVGDYTGLLADIEFLLSRSGRRRCRVCGAECTFYTPIEFVEAVEKRLGRDEVVDIDLQFPHAGVDISEIIARVTARGFVRGRINSQPIRLEEWSVEGEPVESFSVTIDRIKASSPDLRTRILHAFSIAPDLGAARICAVEHIDTPVGDVCAACGSAALVGVSSDLTVESISGATLGVVRELVAAISPRHPHPDGLILRDLLSRLQCAERLGIGDLRMDRRLSELSTGEGYRLALTARVFADVMGLEFELKDPGVTFGGVDAERIGDHLRYLQEDCGAELEASQLEMCLAANVLIDNQLSLKILSGSSGEKFRLSADLVGEVGAINSLNGLSGSGKSRLLGRDIEGFKRIVRLSSDDRRTFKSRTVGALLGLAKPLREFYSNHPHSQAAGLKPSSFSGLLPGERSRATQREYELVRTVKFKGLSYDETLRTDVAALLEGFRHFPRLGSRLKLLNEFGLGFVRPIDLIREFTPPVQRLLRLVEALTSNPVDGTLFVLDEMLAGLTTDQQERAIKQLRLICSRGGTVITTNFTYASR